MTDRTRRIGLSIGAAFMAVGMVAGVFAATQNQNTSEPQVRLAVGGVVRRRWVSARAVRWVPWGCWVR